MGASPTWCCELHGIYRTSATPNKRQAIANAKHTYVKHTHITVPQALHPTSDKQWRQTYWATHICQTHTSLCHMRCTHHSVTGVSPTAAVRVLSAPRKAVHRAQHASMQGRSFLSMLNNVIAMRPTSAPRTPAVLILVQKSATDGTVWAKTGCHFGKLPKQPSLSFCPR